MNTLPFAGAIFGILSAVVIPCRSRAGDAPVPAKPNILVILTDDQGRGDYSAFGTKGLRTPNMDRLFQDGMTFQNFYANCCVCSPTRAALLTGRHCRKVGVHGTNGTDQHMAVEAVTMADLFAASGYATGIFGKWHLGDRFPLRPMDRGFSESVVFPDGAVSTIPDYWGNDYFGDTYWHNGTPQQYKGYCTDVWFSGHSCRTRHPRHRRSRFRATTGRWRRSIRAAAPLRKRSPRDIPPKERLPRWCREKCIGIWSGQMFDSAEITRMCSGRETSPGSCPL